MALIGRLRFGDNGSGMYYKDYLVTSLNLKFERGNSILGQDRVCKCENVTVVTMSPDASDMTLYDWFIDETMLSGCIEMEEDPLPGDTCRRVVKFENARCHKINEKYDISLNERRSIAIEFVPAQVEVEGVVLENEWIKDLQ